MVSGHSLSGTWQGGRHVDKTSDVTIALYVNAIANTNTNYRELREAQLSQQLSSYVILKEWVRQHLLSHEHMHAFKRGMVEIEGRGYLFKLTGVHWGDETSPAYLLLQRTLNDMMETFDCKEFSNCSTVYALEYSHVARNGMEYDTKRMGAYAYAIGVKVMTEVADDFINGQVYANRSDV